MLVLLLLYLIFIFVGIVVYVDVALFNCDRDQMERRDGMRKKNTHTARANLWRFEIGKLGKNVLAQLLGQRGSSFFMCANFASHRNEQKIREKMLNLVPT